jgi:hypothetical protein
MFIANIHPTCFDYLHQSSENSHYLLKLLKVSNKIYHKTINTLKIVNWQQKTGLVNVVSIWW